MKRIATFADRLLAVRHDDGLTLESLAHKINFPSQTINRWERGDRIPKIDTVSSIAESLGISPLWLIGYDVPKYDSVQASPVAAPPTPLHTVPPEYYLLSADNRRAVDDLIKGLSAAQRNRLDAIATDCAAMIERSGNVSAEQPAGEWKK